MPNSPEHYSPTQIKLLHAKIDAFFDHLRVAQPETFHPPCKSGCFWCCYEPALAMQHEADYIVDSMTTEQIETLKPRLKTWFNKAQRFLATSKTQIAFSYRRANIPCPLLVDGKCSVYDRRPLSCREHFALDHPENCEMPMRVHQQYAIFPHPSPIDLYVMQYAEKAGTVIMDHLGLLLCNRVFGANVHSNIAQGFKVIHDEEQPQNQNQPNPV